MTDDPAVKMALIFPRWAAPIVLYCFAVIAFAWALAAEQKHAFKMAWLDSFAPARDALRRSRKAREGT